MKEEEPFQHCACKKYHVHTSCYAANFSLSCFCHVPEEDEINIPMALSVFRDGEAMCLAVCAGFYLVLISQQKGTSRARQCSFCDFDSCLLQKQNKKVIMVTNCVSFINFHYLCVCVFIVVPSVDLALKAINMRLYIQISTCPAFCIYIYT